MTSDKHFLGKPKNITLEREIKFISFDFTAFLHFNGFRTNKKHNATASQLKSTRNKNNKKKGGFLSSNMKQT